ncbi:Uncharacterised protein [Mycobacteroides abscessus subsp. abscessus]|nr:Uncharacterised protein [Mycobacteroides abscessus subsp. abscessus]SIA02329.1 Uncharacterised protein [Mycobacteroides abscessus subsp. abscessus]SIN35799.1 Uncharacterised protein [Mycobacteroides abscessus subsp. abscessus]SKU43299.1 Uncharacterised protein [Mycobacteroides abscessus subsp. abscessus]
MFCVSHVGNASETVVSAPGQSLCGDFSRIAPERSHFGSTLTGWCGQGSSSLGLAWLGNAVTRYDARDAVTRNCQAICRSMGRTFLWDVFADNPIEVGAGATGFR